MLKTLPKEVHLALRSSVTISSYMQCVEELVLNALDGVSTCVAVRINLRTGFIQVADNGHGMGLEQLRNIAQSHHTSKCQSLADLNNLTHYGYRGEALASICQSSLMLEVESRHSSSSLTHKHIFKSGRHVDLMESQNCRPSPGTTVTVYDLFHCLPVRKLCLKTCLELEKIKNRLEAVALIHPNVSISLRNEDLGGMILQTRKTHSVLGAFRHLFGARKAGFLLPVQHQSGVYRVDGYLSTECHHSKTLQYLYINERFVQKCRLHKLVKHVLSASSILQKMAANSSPSRGSPSRLNAYGIYILNICCPASVYDILVEPDSTLVNFADWPMVLRCVEEALKAVLRKESLLTDEESEHSRCAPGDSDTCGSGPAECGAYSSTVELSGTKHSLLVSRLQRGTAPTVTKQVQARRDVAQKADPAQDALVQQASENVHVMQPLNPALNARCQEDAIQDVAKQATDKLGEPHKEKSTQNQIAEVVAEVLAQQKGPTPAIDEALEEVPECVSAAQLVHVTQNPALFHSLHALRQLHAQNKVKQQKQSGSGELTVQNGVSTGERNTHMRIPPLAKMSTPLPRQQPVLCNLKSLPGQTEGNAASSCSQTSNIDTRKNCVPSRGKRKAEMCTSKGSIAAKLAKLRSQTASKNIPLCVKVNEWPEQQLQTISTGVHAPESVDRVPNEAAESTPEESTTSVEQTSCNGTDGRKLRAGQTWECPGEMLERSPLLQPIWDDNSASMEHLSGSKSAVVKHDTGKNGASIGIMSDSNSASVECMSANNSASVECMSANNSASAGLASGSDTAQVEYISRDSSVSMEDADRHNEGLERTSHCSRVGVLENMELSIRSSFYDTSTEQQVAKEISGLVEANEALSAKSVDGRWQALSHDTGGEIFLDLSSGNATYSAPGRDRATLTKGLPPTNLPLLDMENTDPDPVLKGVLFSDLRPGSGLIQHHKLSTDMLEAVQILGQVDKKFIVCVLNRSGDSRNTADRAGSLLVMVDQHAAHERVCVEQLIQESYMPDSKGKQQLRASPVIPSVTVSLTTSEVRLLASYRTDIARLGIKYEVVCGTSDTINVHSVPSCLLEQGCSQMTQEMHNLLQTLVREYLTLLQQMGGPSRCLPAVLHQSLASKACHGAIRFGDFLSAQQCCQLMKELGQCSLPFQCAHGRPSVHPLIDFRQLSTLLPHQAKRPPRLWRLKQGCSI